MMGKGNYIIGMREPIGGDKDPREYGRVGERLETKEVGKERSEERSDRNITPFLHLKLRRRITYEWRESEIDIRRAGGTSHISDGNVIILKVFQGRMRARGETRARVTATDTRVLRDHSTGAWRRNGTWLGGRR